MPRTEITRDDLMELADYSSIRKQKRQELSIIKKNRRVEIGPVATAYFESYETMWWQIQEMLYMIASNKGECRECGEQCE